MRRYVKLANEDLQVAHRKGSPVNSERIPNLIKQFFGLFWHDDFSQFMLYSI